MRDVLVRGIVALSLTITLTCGAAFADVLVNPGFESGSIDPWYNWSFTGEDPPEEMLWNVTTDEAHSGSYSAVGFSYAVVFVQEFDPIPVGEVSQVSLWAKQPIPTGVTVHLWYSDGIGMMGLVWLDSPEWQFVDVTPWLEFGGEELVGVGIMGSGTTLTYADDFVVIPEPGAGGLLAVAALVVRLRRRGGLQPRP